jgi:hypothetical protein
MPTVNIYQNDSELQAQLADLTPAIKRKVAELLSGASIELGPGEVSLRILNVGDGGMLAKIEVEINAAAFEERVKKQDEISLEVQKFLVDTLHTDVKVWLILSELGHSWQNT